MFETWCLSGLAWVAAESQMGIVCLLEKRRLDDGMGHTLVGFSEPLNGSFVFGARAREKTVCFAFEDN